MSAAGWLEEPAIDDPEAERRFKDSVSCDPFPKIPPALLNSSDLYNYVVATGMMFPFDQKYLKSASYAIRIGSKVIYWDGDGTRRERSLAERETFELMPNSIAFIKTKEKFRLPPYIAMRFDLKISNVHKGILLGTGPLVDPGFEGHLLIPLHNLTVNKYTFHEDEPFVWVEFTKTSPHKSWNHSISAEYWSYSLQDKYIPFQRRKKNLSEWDYLDDAFKGPIRSSIPDAIESAKRSAERAARFSYGVGLATLVGVVATLISLFTWGTTEVRTLKGDIDSASTQIEAMRGDARSGRVEITGTLKRLADDLATERGELGRLREIDAEEKLKDLDARLRRLEAKRK